MRAPSIVVPVGLSAIACGLVALVTGCRSLPASKPEALWNEQEARGAQVFHRDCAKCHYPNNTHSLHGPGLQAITKVKAMPSGTPPTDERIASVILHGRNMMTATQLNEDDMNDLLAYIHSL